MPIYEYCCAKCQAEFELLIRGDERAACPSCGSRRVDRQLSVPAAHSGTRTNQLPIAGGCGAPVCGDGVCRAGPCGDFD